MLSILQTLTQIIVAKNSLRHIYYFFLNPEGGGTYSEMLKNLSTFV